MKPPDRVEIVDCDDFTLEREMFREYFYATQEETGYPRQGDL